MNNEAYIGIYVQETVDNAKEGLLEMLADGVHICDADMDDMAAMLMMDENIVGPFDDFNVEELSDTDSLMACAAFKAMFLAIMGYELPNTALEADTAIRKFCITVCREEIYAWYMAQVFMKSFNWD